MNQPLTVVFAENDRLLSLISAILSPRSPQSDDNVARFFREMVQDPPVALAAWRDGYHFRSPLVTRVAMDAGMLFEMVVDADVLVTETIPIGDALLARAPKLKLVYMHNADLRLIDVEACRRRGIEVRALTRHSTGMVAEHTVLMMLMLVKRMPAQIAALPTRALTPDGGWNQNWAGLRDLGHLSDRRIGILGLGEIGQAVARKLRGFGCQMVYTQRTRNLAAETELGATFLGLDEMLAVTDLLSVHVPSTPDTRGMIGEAQLQRMPRGALAVSVARDVLDAKAALGAVRAGHLAGAAFDTFGREPLAPDDPLLTEPRIIVTPHTAAGAIDVPWFDREYRALMTALAEIMP